MAVVEYAIRAKLATDSGVTGIASTRVYRLFAPQTAAFPYVTIQRISTEHVKSFDGLSGLAFARVQIDCYSAVSADQAHLLSDYITNALCLPGGWIVGTVSVYGCNLEDTQELPVGPFDGGARPIYRVMKDYMVGFREEVPV